MDKQNIDDKSTFISNDSPCANDSCREIGAPSDHLKELYDEAKERNPRFIRLIEPENTVIPALEIKATSCCTLRCKDCTHLIPYTRRPAHMPVSDLIGDISKILSAAKIEGLIFLGGEIMIYPHLDKLIRNHLLSGVHCSLNERE